MEQCIAHRTPLTQRQGFIHAENVCARRGACCIPLRVSGYGMPIPMIWHGHASQPRVRAPRWHARGHLRDCQRNSDGSIAVENLQQ